MKYDHMYSLAFSLESLEENPDKVPLADLIAALEKRLRTLQSEGMGAKDAFSHEDSFEIEAPK